MATTKATQKALDTLMQNCLEVMKDLEGALQKNNPKEAERILGRAHALSGALGSKLESSQLPDDLEKGAQFLEVQASLDESMYKACERLNPNSIFGGHLPQDDLYSDNDDDLHQGNVRLGDFNF